MNDWNAKHISAAAAQMGQDYGAALGQIYQGDKIGQTQPRGALENAIDSLANGMCESFAALERLHDRLNLVLQPEYPTPIGAAGNVAGTEPPKSPAVSRLHSLRAQVDSLVCRINAIQVRLDA